MSNSQSTIKRILVPIDGSENASRAAKLGIELAVKFSAELIVLHVITIPAMTEAKAKANPAYIPDLQEYFKSAHETGLKLVNGIAELADKKGVKATPRIVEYALSTVESILEEATKNNVDLVVIGTRGLTGFKKLLIGSISSGVMSHANCTVMVVR